MPVKLPNWKIDPFQKLTRTQKRELKEAAKGFNERLVRKNPNGTFCLGIPFKLKGRFEEPESMTVRRRKLKNYLVPMSKMEPPKLYRGRGRTRRLEREREDRFKNLVFICVCLIISNMDE